MRITHLTEAPRRTATIAFGRMNPPTIGHAKLVDAVKSQPGDPYIFLSQSQKPKTDPLSFEQKLGFAKAFFPGVTVGDPEVRTIFDALIKIHGMGYTDLVYVAGSDRVAQFQELINNYNGQEDFYSFDSIQVVSAGERDPDAEGAEGMSASKMRAAAVAGDFEAFKSGTPNPDLAQNMYDAVKQGMGMMESLERIIEVATMLRQLNEVKPLTEDVKKSLLSVMEAWRYRYNRLEEGPRDLGAETYTATDAGERLRAELGESISEQVDYVKPQFDVEWEEANRYDYLEKLGQAGWIELANKGKVTTVNKDSVKKIGNTGADGSESLDDLEPDKVARLKQAMEKGSVEMPIVVKQPDGSYDLIAGNTRLIGLITTQGSAKVWLVDASELKEAMSPLEKLKKFDRSRIGGPKIFVDKPKSDANYVLRLERDADLLVLHITNTKTGQRTEVRGKSGYETDGYDANDPLHKLLDKIGKAANISQLMNGELVSINPKHPDGKLAKDTVRDIAGESITEVTIDNKNGRGAVPNNMEVDYFGKKVMMKPSTFIKLASKLGKDPDPEMIDYIKKDGAIGAPFLTINVPWDEDDDSKLKVRGHEGRNRMLAILKAEGDAPVETHLFFAGKYNRARHLEPEFIAAINKELISQDDQLVKGPLFTEIAGESITEAGVGRVTRQNQTPDVGPSEIKKQAKKMGFSVDKDGRPPLLHKTAAKNSDPNTLFNMGLAEGQLQERGSIGVPLSGGMTVVISPRRKLKIKKSTPGKLNYEEKKSNGKIQ